MSIVNTKKTSQKLEFWLLSGCLLNGQHMYIYKLWILLSKTLESVRQRLRKQIQSVLSVRIIVVTSTKPQQRILIDKLQLLQNGIFAKVLQLIA